MKKKKGNFFENFFASYHKEKVYYLWVLQGRPIPPPEIVKQKLVKVMNNSFQIRIFIETGTYLGEMVNSVKEVFNKIYSIELNHDLYEKAKNRFSEYNHINILEGDSIRILPTILKKIDEPCLFWLDGHYSEGITSKGEKNTPIMEELTYISQQQEKRHVILIDDARLFIGKNDYPTIIELRDFVNSNLIDYTFEIKDDIILIGPRL